MKIRVLNNSASARCALIALIALAPVLSGCFFQRTSNVTLEHAEPRRGYRLANAESFRERGDILIYLAFSGGGTRAAALAYGVMEALRDTEVVIEGKKTRLIDEVDTLSGVSGGSFPAAYYALFGDRIFEEFEPRFLKRNITAAIVGRALRPWNLVGLFTPWVSRSELAMEVYNETIFERATFGDLTRIRGPRVIINATDLSSGERFVFNQGYFDVICSDLDPLPVATAVAASSAVPALLSPVSLRNHAGTCGFELPDALKVGLTKRREDPRRYRAVAGLVSFTETDKRYLHLIDGGVADNLGMRAGLDLVSAGGGLVSTASLLGTKLPEHIVMIAVNAETEPPRTLDLSRAAPSFAAMMRAVSGSQIRRYNFETLVLAREAVRNWTYEAARMGINTKAHVIEVGFENINDPAEKRQLQRLPTSFSLSDRDVDHLRDVGRRLLNESPDFQELLRDLN